MANDDRISGRLLAEWERLAQEGLRGGLLEQAWSRRALALVREIRILRKEQDPAGTDAPSPPPRGPTGA